MYKEKKEKGKTKHTNNEQTKNKRKTFAKAKGFHGQLTPTGHSLAQTLEL